MSHRAKLVLALASIYLVWGSTYLGIAIGVRTLPPLLMASVRFVVAGLLLFAGLRATGAAMPERATWKTALVAGTLLIGGGNGVVTLNAHALPSGVVSLILAVTPLFMVLLPWIAGGERPSAIRLFAIALGLGGVAVLAGLGGGALPLGPLIAIVLSSLSWTVGSLVSKRMPQPASPLVATAQQMLVGGLVLFGLAALHGELGTIDAVTPSDESLAALVYLTLVGSIVGYGAYVWLLRNTAPDVAASYAYVNPFVALLLGHLVADEPLEPRILVAGAMIVVAVVVLVRASRARG